MTVKEISYLYKMERDLSHALYLCALEKYSEAFPTLYLYKDKEEDRVLYYLALCYYYGYGVDINIDVAKEYLEKAVSNGDKDALLFLANIEEDEEAKIKFLKSSYIAGSIEALDSLKNLATNKKKKKELIKFLNSLSTKDNHAEYLLGWLYLEINEIDNALKHLVISAKDKNEEACLLLAKIYEEGREVEVSLDKAAHYYREAAYFEHKENLEELASFYIRHEYYEDALFILKKIEGEKSLHLRIELLEKLHKQKELIALLSENATKDKLCALKLGDYHYDIDDDLALFYYLKAYDYEHPNKEIHDKIVSLCTLNPIIIPVDIKEYLYYLNSLLIESGFKLDDINDKQILKFLEVVCYRFGLINYHKDKVRSDTLIHDLIMIEDEYSYLAYLFAYLFSTNLHFYNPIEANKILNHLEDNYLNNIIIGFTYLLGYINPRDYHEAYNYFLKAHDEKESILIDILLDDVSYRLHKEYICSIDSKIIKSHHAYLDFYQEYHRYHEFKSDFNLNTIAQTILDYPPFAANAPLYKKYLKDIDIESLFEIAKDNDYPYYLLTKATIKMQEHEYQEALKLSEEAYFKKGILEAMVNLYILDKKKYDYSFLLYAARDGSLIVLYYYAYFHIQDGEANEKIFDMISVCYDMGIVNAGLLLGMLYIQGRVVKRDYALGEALIKKAVADGATIKYDPDTGVIREIN